MIILLLLSLSGRFQAQSSSGVGTRDAPLRTSAGEAMKNEALFGDGKDQCSFTLFR